MRQASHQAVPPSRHHRRKYRSNYHTRGYQHGRRPRCCRILVIRRSYRRRHCSRVPSRRSSRNPRRSRAAVEAVSNDEKYSGSEKDGHPQCQAQKAGPPYQFQIQACTQRKGEKKNQDRSRTARKSPQVRV